MGAVFPLGSPKTYFVEEVSVTSTIAMRHDFATFNNHWSFDTQEEAEKWLIDQMREHPDYFYRAYAKVK